MLDSVGNTSEMESKKYDIIVSPEAVTLDYLEECADLPSVPKCWCTAQTVIKWNITSPEGKEIYTSAVKSDEVKIYRSRKAERCIIPSLKNNFEKAREDIYSSGWWKLEWARRVLLSIFRIIFIAFRL